jgi:mannose-1-phosphate guanylyltransferase / phosphomannomutase
MTGGKGLRLKPLTFDIPKPLIPVKGKPILLHIVENAKKYGITDFIFCNGYLHEKLEQYFGNGEKLGVNITHSNEPEPLGTSGALAFAKQYINPDEPFLVFQGDVMNHLNITKFVEFHESKKASGSLGTLVIHPSSHPQDSDIVEIDEDCKVTRIFRPEKGAKEGIDFTNLCNAGAFILEPKILDYITEGEFAILEKITFNKVLNSDHNTLFGYNTEDYLKDMGTPERLEQVEDYLKELE